jgi:tRNA threonylcarbamoyl adenosine modification protein YeaZ
MNVLALETSMGACSAAVLRAEDASRKLFVRQERMERGHAEALMPMVAEVMAEADIGPSDLDLIAATTGPGSFTGVRIAIAAARGLALVTTAKLFGIDSLAVMAREARLSGAVAGEPFAVAVDARRGMLYLGLYEATGTRRDGPLLIAPDDAVLSLNDVHLAVGSGAKLLAEAAGRRGHSIEAKLLELQPSAAVLAEIAGENGETTPILRPLYLRPPDARPQAQGVARR